jgi:hypothetical protein
LNKNDEKMVGSGRVSVSRKRRVNAQFLKAPHKLAFKVPPWTKVCSLTELAEDLRKNFPSDVSAAEMIERSVGRPEVGLDANAFAVSVKKPTILQANLMGPRHGPTCITSARMTVQ